MECWGLGDVLGWSFDCHRRGLMLWLYCWEAWWSSYGDMPEARVGSPMTGDDAFAVVVYFDSGGHEEGSTTVVTQLTQGY